MGKGGAAVWDEKKHCKCEMGYLFKCCFLVFRCFVLTTTKGIKVIVGWSYDFKTLLRKRSDPIVEHLTKQDL